LPRVVKRWVQGTIAVVLAVTGLSKAQSTHFEHGESSRMMERDVARQVDRAGVISRSDIILARPNLEATQAVTLGNGSLGVAVWSADGLTAQLNRGDTLPELLPVARISIPTLAPLIQAKDYSGRLSLYDAEFREQGAGQTVSAFVDMASDNLVIDVTGANPSEAQIVHLHLPADPILKRAPKAEANGVVGILSEAWVDDQQPGASGRNFGSLAAVTAQGLQVSVSVTDAETITVTFHPFPDGHFRVVVAAPHFNAQVNPPVTAAKYCLTKITGTARASSAVATQHRDAWHNFWHRASYMKITSSDGSGEYMENLRALYLYSARSESGGEYPGSQAGVADLLSSAPSHHWDPAAYWHWNLRMQIAANLSSGMPELNTPYFNLYRSNLKSFEDWTQKHMAGRPGICVPETMRFNGPGIEYETWDTTGPPIIGLNCAADSKPYYNARTLSTGAEVAHWIWQQYQLTNDRKFLSENFPVMWAASRFLMSYETPKSDGLLHTTPSNAHETQWDVVDPTTDLAARTVLYADTLHAAQVLGMAGGLNQQLETELSKIPPFPRTEATQSRILLAADADASKSDVIGDSYEPASETHNVENIGLDPVWPYDLVGDSSPLFDLAKRTYEHRPNPINQDWSFDPIQAARLGLRNEVRSTLIKLTEKYQTFVNGYANWGGTSGEFYIEQQGVVAAALNEALVQDYDGLIRINPAFPSDWDVQGQVAVRGNTRVNVKVNKGTVENVVIDAGSSGTIKLRNPWGQDTIELISADGSVKTLSGATVEFSVAADRSYILHGTHAVAPPVTEPKDVTVMDESLKKQSIALKLSGTAATTAKRLGPVQIGIFPEAR
jgi:alpha-L-fucosidase 2